jgi:UDP-N-acetylmuramate dehydrogenase
VSVPEVREDVPLARYTTLRLGGPARRFVTAATQDDLIEQVRRADERGEPLLVLGGGSNLVVADSGFPGTVVGVRTAGIQARAVPGAVSVTVAAGQDWDSFVAWSVSQGLSGLECLSGIPGLAGATPIQNVGAYGQEISQVITEVHGYDRSTGAVLDLPAARCGFGYRTSAFKREAAARPGGVTGRFVVLTVTFTLARVLDRGREDPGAALSAPVRYRELARALDVTEGERAPLTEVREAVLALRRAKGMVLDPADPDTRSAGSFFTNPVLSEDGYADLVRTVAQAASGAVTVPRFPADDGQVKVSAAWLIERAGFPKGYPSGASAAGPAAALDTARISAKHTLALVNPGGASAGSLLALAREIRDGVRKTFGVELTPEPVLVGTTL